MKLGKSKPFFSFLQKHVLINILLLFWSEPIIFALILMNRCEFKIFTQFLTDFWFRKKIFFLFFFKRLRPNFFRPKSILKDALAVKDLFLVHWATIFVFFCQKVPIFGWFFPGERGTGNGERRKRPFSGIPRGATLHRINNCVDFSSHGEHGESWKVKVLSSLIFSSSLMLPMLINDQRQICHCPKGVEPGERGKKRRQWE